MLLTFEQPLQTAILIVGAIAALSLALRRWPLRQVRPTAGTGALLLSCAALWMFTNGMELASGDLSTALFWNQLQFVGIVPVSTLWLIMAMQFVGTDHHLTASRLLVLAVVPAVTLTLALTNDFHHLLLVRAWLQTQQGVTYLDTEFGVILWLFYAYAYALVALGTYWLVRKLVRDSRVFRWQGAVVLLGMAISLAGNIVDISHLSPLPHIKLTPLGLILAIPLFIVTLVRVRRADILPVARGNILQIMDDSVIVLDFEQRVLDINPSAEKLMGCALQAAAGQPINTVWPVWGQQRAALLDETNPSHEIRIGQGDQLKVLDVSHSQLNDWHGQPVSQVLVLRDVTDRVRAEENLRQREAHFRALTENASDLVLIVNQTGNIQYASPSIERIFGLEMDSITRQPVTDFIHPDDLPQALATLAEILQRPGSADPVVARFRRADGSWRTLECVANNLLTHPAVGGVVVNARDITERVDAEARLRASLAEKELLLKEIHHRVKNNLQVIASLLNLQTMTLEDDQVAATIADSQHRIRAMALIHEQLYQSNDLARIDFAQYVQGLGAYLMGSHLDEKANIDLTVAIDDIHLDIDTAIPCGLIINELVTNALKHAFPEGHCGTICVTMRQDGTQGYTLTVSDDGIGLPVAFDLRQTQSLGLRLVNRLTTQLHGTLQLHRNPGTTIALDLPHPNGHQGPHHV